MNYNLSDSPYKDAFEILEIDFTHTKYEDLSLEYLKKQYRKLALKNHPDKNGNTHESNEKFQKINEAYHYLKREIKHLNYDDIDHDISQEIDHTLSSPCTGALRMPERRRRIAPPSKSRKQRGPKWRVELCETVLDTTFALSSSLR